MVALALLLQEGYSQGGGTGLEWMTIASVVVPIVLLLVFFWYSNKRAVM